MPTPVAVSGDDVFINCPFDDPYRPMFEALIFCIHACGFRPRSAREVDDAGQARLDKLFGIIEESRYGIHDISRTELDDENGLPRFNMPLELGIFYGAKRYGGEAQKAKKILILDVEKYRYQKFISDLAGMDIHAHGGDPQQLIEKTRDWLANVSRRKLPSAARVAKLYAGMLADLPQICDALEFAIDAIPYVDFEQIVVNWLLEARPVE